jgi:hypothetical protein
MTRAVKITLSFGIAGVVIALSLAEIASHYSVSPIVLILLWPTSIFGAAFNGPTFSPLGVFIAAIELGGNFIIYSLIGFLVASLVSGEGRKV